jgi:soluble lytic murein transglycosylase-like protein
MASVAAATLAPVASASELVTLKNGFNLVCDHRESIGDRVRLYLSSGDASFVEFGPEEIASVEPAPAPPTPPTANPALKLVAGTAARASLTAAELRQMLAAAGAQHNLEVDLLASVVHAESGGNARAVSRAGARGLMQLMPRTAAQLGVNDSFRPEENIRGGAAYLDSLLAMYRDNLALALAAYNAGPAAVARWHGVPPYRETRAYVARVIREFNAGQRAQPSARTAANALASNTPLSLPTTIR